MNYAQAPLDPPPFTHPYWLLLKFSLDLFSPPSVHRCAYLELWRGVCVCAGFLWAFELSNYRLVFIFRVHCICHRCSGAWLAVDLSTVISLFPSLSICFSSLRWFQYIKGVAFRFWQGRMGSSIVYSEGAFLVIFYANIEWLYPLFFLSTDVFRVWGPVYLFPEFIVDRSIMLSCYRCSQYCREGWGEKIILAIYMTLIPLLFGRVAVQFLSCKCCGKGRDSVIQVI